MWPSSFTPETRLRCLTRFYFATPHHAWERGTNENTNGLLRQYLPKRRTMAHLSTPEESYAR